MRILFAIILSLSLLPIYAQNSDEPYWIFDHQEEPASLPPYVWNNGEPYWIFDEPEEPVRLPVEINVPSPHLPLYVWDNSNPYWIFDQSEEINSEPEKIRTPFTFPRNNFEFGIDVGAGFDNDLVSISDVLKKEIVIDLNQIGGNIRDSGFNFNVAAIAGLYFNVKNIRIKQGIWDFGFFSGADGNVKLNLPKSLFALITEGNADNHSIEGTISALGGFYAEAGLSASVRFDKLRIGIKPALFSPLLFIPKVGSGINYSLTTDDKISISSSGEISIYSPFIEDGELNFGFDFSLEGEYALLSFLDVGGSLSRIPIVPATVNNRLRLTLDEIEFGISGEDMLNGDIQEFPEFKYNVIYDTFRRNVFRPIRFDLYVRYKPLTGEFLVIKPNIGFSVDINNEQGFFNAGVEVRLNLKDIFLASLSINYMESVWIHKLGLALNLRAFELSLQAALRSESFIGSFMAQGIGVNLGLRFGW